MSYLHDDLEDDAPPSAAYNAQHRELTLSTGTILGIFLGLALLCAVFFGFGYSMGTRSKQSPTVVSESSPDSSGAFNNFSKPNAGAPASAPQPATTTVITQPAPTHAVDIKPAPTANEPAPIVRTPAPATTTAPAPAPKPAESSATRSAAPATEAGLTFLVQVAAVSHQEDAEMLSGGLRRKGYNVSTRTEPQDKLFHIQIGPFATKKDAEVMRQRLQADGYNAMIK